MEGLPAEVSLYLAFVCRAERRCQHTGWERSSTPVACWLWWSRKVSVPSLVTALGTSNSLSSRLRSPHATKIMWVVCILLLDGSEMCICVVVSVSFNLMYLYSFICVCSNCVRHSEWSYPHLNLGLPCVNSFDFIWLIPISQMKHVVPFEIKVLLKHSCRTTLEQFLRSGLMLLLSFFCDRFGLR